MIPKKLVGVTVAWLEVNHVHCRRRRTVWARVSHLQVRVGQVIVGVFRLGMYEGLRGHSSMQCW